MTPADLFARMRQASLPLLTSYHPDAKTDDIDPFWLHHDGLPELRSASHADGLMTAKPIDLYPDNPFERSKYRPKGYALWDFIVRNNRTAMRRSYFPDACGPITDPTSTPKGGLTNTWWYKEVQPVWLANRMTEGALDPWLVNFTADNQRWLLKAAHAMAHDRTDRNLTSLSFWQRFTFSSRAFLQCAAELAAAAAYSLPVNLKADNILPHGLLVCPTGRAGFMTGKPALQVPYGPNCPIDTYLVCLNVAVVIGNDPLNFLLPGAQPSAVDRLAYEPTMAIPVGWELASWVFGQDLARYERQSLFDEPVAGFTVPAADLLPPKDLGPYLEAAREAWPTNDDYRMLSGWKNDSWLAALINQTPLLPCLSCILLNRWTEHGLRLPTAEVLRAPEERAKYEKAVRKTLGLVARAKAANNCTYRKRAAERRDAHHRRLSDLAAEAKAREEREKGIWNPNRLP